MIQTRTLLLCALFALSSALSAQKLTLPATGGNKKCTVSQQIGITDVEIAYNAPGVKGRENKIWGTPVAYYGFQDQGFGTSKAAPWRAGANEAVRMRFSTDVKIEGKALSAGSYGFYVALYSDSCTLIFSRNSSAWGSFFYDPSDDVLRVTVRQQKNLPQSREWLSYSFQEQTDNSAVVALEWEHWRIPFKVEVDLNETVVASIRRELTGAAGFDIPSLQAAAGFCLDHNTNLTQALAWAESAADPNMGGKADFGSLSLQARILEKMGRSADATAKMEKALDVASIFEMHGYGRQLLAEKKYKEALAVFEKNYAKNGDAWPTQVGLARGYSANGDLKKALEHAKKALTQAPDDLNKKNLETMVKTLSEGKALGQ